MSTALAVAATTRVLCALIEESVGRANLDATVGASPHVTSQAPDRLELGGQELSQLSLFLYHVTHNQGWREVGLPSRSASGDAIARPPLALDLHYLLTAYGPGDYAPQMLLGLGMQALHESPVLHRETITRVFTAPPPLSDLDKVMATAQLADQIEVIKVTPEPLTTEDLSKLWTAFGGKFRTCVGYAATVVLIESTTPVRASLPVLRPNLSVVQFRQPSITAVAPEFLPWSSSVQVKLRGANLTGDGVAVVFDGNPGMPQIPQRLDTAGTEVRATLPPLPAGINTVRVVRALDIGADSPRNVVESNVALFHLQPVIRRDPPPAEADLIMVGPTDPANLTTLVTVQVDPAIQPGQRVQLRLNEAAPPSGESPRSYTFDAGAGQISPHKVAFATFGTRAGKHLVRVAVDGAESQLRTDPVAGFVGPLVTL